jgi:hypothetical protein
MDVDGGIGERGLTGVANKECTPGQVRERDELYVCVCKSPAAFDSTRGFGLFAPRVPLKPLTGRDRSSQAIVRLPW